VWRRVALSVLKRCSLSREIYRSTPKKLSSSIKKMKKKKIRWLSSALLPSILAFVS
jgi:hypothetical protein